MNFKLLLTIIDGASLQWKEKKLSVLSFKQGRPISVVWTGQFIG